MKIKLKKIKLFFPALLFAAVIWLWKGGVEALAYNYATTGAVQAGTITIEPVNGSSQVNGYYGLGGYQITYSITKDSWKAFDSNFGGYFYIGNLLNAKGGCSFGRHNADGIIWEDGAVQLGSLTDGTLVARCDAVSDTVSCTFRVSSLSELPAYIAYAYQPASSAYLHLSTDYGDQYHVWYYQSFGEAQVLGAPTVDMTGPLLDVVAEPAGTTVNVQGKIWSKKAVLKATAKDEQSRPGGICFYQNNVMLLEKTDSNNATAMEAVYTVDHNGTYEVQAYDKLKNASNLKTATVSCIDTQAPVINDLKAETEDLCKSNKITIAAYDAGCGLAELPFSWNDGPWTADAEFTAEENGVYTVKVRDALGNESSKSITISNIDNKPPVIEFEIKRKGKIVYRDGAVWSTEAALLIRAVDDGSGIDRVMVWDQNGKAVEIWEHTGEAIEKEVFFETENLEKGIYKIIAEDRMGNRAEDDNAECLYVDNTAPVIESLEAVKAEQGNDCIQVTAKDNPGGIGLPEKPYSFDEGKTWQAAPCYQIDQNGVYRVMVRDALGSVSRAEIEVDITGESVWKNIEETGGEEKHPANDDGSGNDNGSNGEKNGGMIKTDKSPEAASAKIMKRPTPPSVRHSVMAEENMEEAPKSPVMQMQQSESSEKDPVQKALFIILLMLFGAGLLGLVLYLMLSWLHYSCVVYAVGEKQEKSRLCRLPVKQYDGDWQVKVPDSKLGIQGTGKYLFVFRPSFIKEEEPGNVIIIIDGRSLRERLAEEITVSI